MMTDSQRYLLQMKATSNLLRKYFSRVPSESLRRRYGYSEKMIRELANSYKQGIIEIFEVRGQKKIAMSEMTHKEEVDLLQMIIKSLERTLKMANIKAEGFEYMNGSPEGVWNRPVKKVEAERLKHSKKSTWK